MTMVNRIGQKTLRVWPWLAGAAALWLALRWMGWSRQGFDFQDEGSYLLIAQDPWRNMFSSLFGFVLHPLYLLSFRDPGWFRLLSLVFLAGAALGCAWVWCKRERISFSPRTGVAAFLISGALLVYSDGQRTPSYNTLVFFGTLLAWTGYFGLWQEKDRRFWPWCAIINGIALAFLAKWPSGVLLVPLLGWLIWKNKLWRRSDLFLVIGPVVLVGVFWFWWIGKTAIMQTARMVDLLVNESISHGPQLFPYYFATLLNFFYRSLRAFAYGAPLLFFLWFLRKKKPIFFLRLADFIWLLPLAVLLGGLIFGLTRAGASSFSRVGSNVLAEVLWLAAGSLLVVPFRQWVQCGFRADETLALALTPFVLGFGTASALGDYAGHGALFFQLGGLGFWLILWRSGVSREFLVSLLFLGTVLNIFRAEASLRDQFRTAPMQKCTLPWASPDGGTVYLDAEQAGLLGDLRDRMEASGFKPGDPIVAIGDMPGVVYFLKGYSPGVNWYPATRPEHLKYVLAVLKTIPGEVRKKTFLIMNEKTPLLEQKDQILDWVGFGTPAIIGPYRLNYAPEKFLLWPPQRSQE